MDHPRRAKRLIKLNNSALATSAALKWGALSMDSDEDRSVWSDENLSDQEPSQARWTYRDSPGRRMYLISDSPPELSWEAASETPTTGISTEKACKGDRNPLLRLKGSYLFRSIASRSCGPTCMFERPQQELSGFYPYQEALAVSQNDITEDGFPPDQRSGPISAHMHLLIWIKGGINIPKSNHGGVVEISLLDETYKQKFCPDSGCEDAFKFFVHESTMVIEETTFSDQQAMAVVKISYFYGFDRSNNSRRLVGSAEFSLKALLRQPIQGMDIRAYLMDEDDAVATGEDGAPFEILASIQLDPLEQDSDEVQIQGFDLSVISCRHLPKMDILGTCDPFCEIKFSGHTRKTSVISNTYNATWLETFQFHIVGNEKFEDLCIQVYDANITRKELVGQLVIAREAISSIICRPKGWNTLCSFSLERESGQEVVGSNGKKTMITLRFKALKALQIKRSSPTLENILEACEGKYQLRKPYVLRMAAATLKPENQIAPHEVKMLEKIGLRSKDVEYYWREELERVLEGPLVAFVICSMIIIDVVLIIDFEALLNRDDTSAAVTSISAVVLMSFVVELVLRNIAQRLRFWTITTNVFDFLVVSASLLMAAANRFLETQLAMQNPNSVQLQQTTDVLKGFNLDVTYVTDRVLVMSAPAFGGHSAYRNDIREVSRFFATRHYGHHRIFNFCDTADSSDGVNGNYHPKLLSGQVRRIPFEDHGPPLLIELVQFCEEAGLFLSRNPRNVICVHCKGGKGRSGMMAAAFLLWSGHRKCALDALELFTFRRTSDYHPEDGLESDDNSRSKRQNVGVQGPSQIRYVHYLEAILYCNMQPETSVSMYLKEACIPIGVHQATKPWYISCQVLNMRSVIFDSAVNEKSKFFLGGSLGSSCCIPLEVVVAGDVRINFFLHRTQKRKRDRVLSFFFVFHTNFYVGSEKITFRKERIDIMAKDTQNKKTHADFAVNLTVSYSSDSCDLMDAQLRFQNLVSARGETVDIQKGEALVKSKNVEKSLYLILDGSAEGVVQEFQNRPMHPLGCCFGRRDRVRVPDVCIVGSGHLLGSSQFLNSVGSMTYRVRSSSFRAACLHVDFSPLDDWARNWTAFANKNLCEKVTFQAAKGHESEWSMEDMILLFRGICIKLAMFVSRVATQAFRIGRLRSLDNCDHINEIEALRFNAERLFGIPCCEYLCHVTKCWYESDGGAKKQVRLVIFTGHVIIDTEIFGPVISRGSEVICTHQIRAVHLERGLQPKCVNLEFIRGKDNRLEKCCCNLTPPTSEKTMEIYELLRCMHWKNKNDYLDQTQNTIETVFFQELLEKCARVHPLKLGEQLRAVRNSQSLFVVRTGQLKICRDGRVCQKLRQGSCLGEAEFILKTATGSRTAQAIEGPATVFELRWDDAMAFVKPRPVLEVLFYRALGQLLDRRKRLHLDEAYPGSWCLPDIKELHAEMSLTWDQTELQVPKQLNLYE